MPGAENVATVAAASAGANVIEPGPLVMLQASAGVGSTRPSSVTVPESAAVAGSVIARSVPSVTVGGRLTGGATVIVIGRVVVPVPPLVSVTVSVTVKVFAVVNVCVGATPVPAAVPSPKVQA